MDLVNFEMKKLFNTMTLANGGTPVRLRRYEDTYPTLSGQSTDIVSPTMQGKQVNTIGIGKEWIPLIGFSEAYDDNCYRPFKAATGTTVVTATSQLTKDTGYVGPNPDTTSNVATATYVYSINSDTGRVQAIVDGASTAIDIKDVRPGNIPLGMLERNEYTRDEDAFNGIAPGPILTDPIVELPWYAWSAA